MRDLTFYELNVLINNEIGNIVIVSEKNFFPYTIRKHCENILSYISEIDALPNNKKDTELLSIIKSEK